MTSLKQTIDRLLWERQQIDKALAALQMLQENPNHTGRRGRKSMGHEERQEVSRRMKSYWAKQRKARTA